MMNSNEKKSLIILVVIIVVLSVGYVFADMYITTLPSEVKRVKVVSSVAEKEEALKKEQEQEEANQQKTDGSSGQNDKDNTVSNKQQGGTANQDNKSVNNNTQKNNINNSTNNTQKKVNIKKYKTTRGYEYFHYKGYLFLNGAKMKLPNGFKFVEESQDALSYSDYKVNSMAVVSQEYTGDMNINVTALFMALGTAGTTGPEKQVAFGKNKYRYRKYVVDSGQSQLGNMTTHVFITGNNKRIVAFIFYSLGSDISWAKGTLASVGYY